MISFLIGFFLAFGSFIYLVIKMVQYDNSSENDETFHLEQKTDTSGKATCGNNIRKK
jgi:hypothetical protein